MTEQIIKYEFNALTPSEFEVSLFMEQESKFFNMILAKTKEKLKRKGLQVTGSTDEVNEFELDQFNLNAVNTIIRPQMAEVRKQVAQDNIKILSWRAIKTKYINRKDLAKWDIEVIVSGMYQDDRE